MHRLSVKGFFFSRFTWRVTFLFTFSWSFVWTEGGNSFCSIWFINSKRQIPICCHWHLVTGEIAGLHRASFLKIDGNDRCPNSGSTQGYAQISSQISNDRLITTALLDKDDHVAWQFSVYWPENVQILMKSALSTLVFASRWTERKRFNV